ncbi:AAA family ATPase [Sphingobacterium sp. UT-1RO-CII-1]|uniref:AAA family ATPase n=1 Tax=Sphingobacterium sp. UT-1RO-CII-1 TaxID=2995225 RepID=UPI00227D08DF|nr:AAA family ATPase [Sphingobacterium sp. UT-1RO-CII-1]MCY4779254.1 AAA family ATPase [Sphingobacterium sp. UT-1RO-CII-1]
MNNLFVITGGPGAGKTTLLNSLEAKGYKVIPEVARIIIRKEVERKGDALPWKNKELYTDKMITASIQDYKTVNKEQQTEICFFDRGTLDALCYAEMIGYTLAPEIIEKVRKCKYNSKVFILPPWKEIYTTDTERKQDWKEANDTYTYLKNMYERFGYEVVVVPIGTVDERKEFILNQIS